MKPTSLLLLVAALATIPAFSPNPVDLTDFCHKSKCDRLYRIHSQKLDSLIVSSTVFSQNVRILKDYKGRANPALWLGLATLLSGIASVRFSQESSRLHANQQKLVISLVEDINRFEYGELAKTAAAKSLVDSQLIEVSDHLRLEREIQLAAAGATLSKLQPSISQPTQDIESRLKSHEDGWLWTLVSTAKPVILTGGQGSGKTTFCCAIARLRRELFGYPVVTVIDRHYGANKGKWAAVQPQKIVFETGEIPSTFDYYCTEFVNRMNGSPATEQLIIDEFTNLKSDPETKDAAEAFFRALLTDTRKAGIRAILISHATTNSCFPAGTLDQRKAASLCVEKFSIDGSKPTNRIQLVWGFVDKQGTPVEKCDRTIPNWVQ
ncbi:MAG: ATP-binding protein [Candidatus Nanopelagicaceae bacterium]